MGVLGGLDQGSDQILSKTHYLQVARVHSEARQCQVCRGPVNRDYLVCYQCSEAKKKFTGLLDTPLAVCCYALFGHQMATVMTSYKKTQVSSDERQVVGNLLYRAIRYHLGCVGSPPIDAVMWIPSFKGRNPHPLRHILGVIWDKSPISLPPLSDDLGGPSDLIDHGREIREDAYQIEEHDAGGHVLIVDDTWTSGSNIQSAAIQLHAYGWEKVSALVAARWVSNTKEDKSKELVKQLEAKNSGELFGYSHDYCPFLGNDCIQSRLGL